MPPTPKIHTWPREKDGPTLPLPPPKGYRPPNGIMWAHDLDEFCWISSHPDVLNVSTVWSRSMIKEFGENYTEELQKDVFNNPDFGTKPRRRRPWPVLRVAKGHGEGKGKSKVVTYHPPLGLIDEGSDHEGEEVDCEIALADSDSDDDGPALLPTSDESGEGGREPFYANLLWNRLGESWILHTVKVQLYGVKRPRMRCVVKYHSKVRSPPTKLVEASSPALEVHSPANDVSAASVPGDVKKQDDSPSAFNFDISKSSDAPKENDNLTMAADDARSVREGGANEVDSGRIEAHPAAVFYVEDRNQEFGRYSIEGIPALEESIPMTHFPDILIVHDPCDLSEGKTPEVTYQYDEFHAQLKEQFSSKKGSTKPTLYQRIAPRNASTGRNSNQNTAHIYLSPYNEAGRGHHSIIYRTPLTLPPPLTTYKSSSTRLGTVRVIAKIAIQNPQARDLICNEGYVYSSFPEHLAEEYCGWHRISPFMTSPVPSCSVVPKFYGYYVPVSIDEVSFSTKSGDELWGRGVSQWKGRSPIILIEDCGIPIDPHKMDVDQRAECFSLLLRLHCANYLHNSFHIRNIVVKPGPLTRRPEERSMKTPSFRVIDFGRSQEQSVYLGYALDDWRLREETRIQEEKEAKARKVPDSVFASTVPSSNSGEKTEDDEKKKKELITKLKTQMNLEVLNAKRELLLKSIWWL